MTDTTPRRDLAGKVALVVGGSRNLGAAFADTIAARGATTVISYATHDDDAKDVLAAMEGHGITAEAIKSDATRAPAVNTLFDDVLTRHGRLDIVVHTPGAVLRRPLVDLTDEDFDLLIDMNIRSVFNTLRAASRHLRDGGRYVVISSTLTSLMPGPYGLYSGAKAAVERMVLAAAIELGDRRITVNAVAPGPVDDDFYRAAETPESIEGVIQHTPFGRLGRVEDIAPVVGWLVSDDAAWVSGQTIRANGALA